MTPASPELRKLYLKVIRRVHPDGAVDEQDRLRCERLTQRANQAYGIRDEAALRAVLEPQARRLKWKSHAAKPQWSGLRTKLLAITGIAIALAALSSYFISTLTSPMAPAAGKQQQAAAERRNRRPGNRPFFPSKSYRDASPPLIPTQHSFPRSAISIA